MVQTYKDTAPEQWLNRTKEYSEVINGPKTGCDDNYWFPSFQLNIAPAQDGDAGAYPTRESKYKTRTDDGQQTGHWRVR